MTAPKHLENWKPSTWQLRVRDFVGETCGVTPEQLIGRARNRTLVRVRHMAMYVVYDHFASLSYPQLGRMFSDRDHSTVIHGVRMHEERMKRDSDLAEFTRMLLDNIGPAGPGEVGAVDRARIAEAAAALHGDIDRLEAAREDVARQLAEEEARLARLRGAVAENERQREERMVATAREQAEARKAAVMRAAARIPDRKVKPKNALDPDDTDAFKRRSGSIALGEALKRAREETAAEAQS